MAYNLKTDYKDWIPNAYGMQYDIGPTSLGHSSITDVTTYDQRGDEWEAAILNQTNSAVNQISLDVDNVIYRLDNTLNPLTGNFESYENVFRSFMNWIMSLHNLAPITPDEYDALSIDPAAYDALQIDPHDYDTNGKNILTAAFGG